MKEYKSKQNKYQRLHEIRAEVNLAKSDDGVVERGPFIHFEFW